MNNVKLSFERYLDVKSLQRRQSLLRWSLDTSNESHFVPLYMRDRGGDSVPAFEPAQDHNTDKSSLFNVSMLLNSKLRGLEDVRSHVQRFSRNIASTNTRFFNNNFDMLVNESSDCASVDQDTFKSGQKQLRSIQKDLRLFQTADYTPDVVKKVNVLFHWLYDNKLYSLAYELVADILPTVDVFFRYQELSAIIVVIDQFGTVDDLLHLSQVYKTKPLPSILKRAKRLGNLKVLVQLGSVKKALADGDFNVAKPLIDNLVTQCDGVRYLLFKIIDKALFNSTSKELKDYIMNTQHVQYLTPRTHIFIYDNTQLVDVQARVNHLINVINLHPSNENFEYRIYESLAAIKKRAIAFRVWYELHYKQHAILNTKLSLGGSYPHLERLHAAKLDLLPKSFSKELQLTRDDYSAILTLLIYTHVEYGKDYAKVKAYYSLKKQLSFSISTTDKLCYVAALVNSKDYDNILTAYEDVMQSALESPKLMDDLMVSFARTHKWKEMEQLYLQRFLHSSDISEHQYTALFISLSMRSGSIKFILKLWETFIKAGYSPTDHIICCIIIAFMKSKAYREALQWFSAYSKYKIPLSAKSYALMLNILASTRDTSTAFQLLDTLDQQGKNLKGKFMGSILNQFASVGDYKSIERLLLEYYPKFDIKITNQDTRWILKSHYFANRFSVISKQFWKTTNDDLDYDLTLLALESTIKMKDVREFRAVWERIYPIFKERGELDARIFGLFMAYWVRVYGLFGLEEKLESMKRSLKVTALPTAVYNQMIFSCIRTKKPWLVSKVVQMASGDGVQLTPKTYSLILYAYVSSPWIAEKSVDKCITIIDEILNKKKKDQFGMVDQDLSPVAFKMVVKAIIKQNDVYEARRLFELYLETSTNNLLDNIHVLNVELMLLGEEERWVEFDECYKKYVEILERNMVEAKMLSESHTTGKVSVPRSERVRFAEFGIHFDDHKIRQNNQGAKIPLWLKHAHFDVWQYRLKQLEITESLAGINEEFAKLQSKHIVMSNKNLNETALVLSSKSGLFDETIEFINKNILPWHVKAKSHNWMKLRHGWGGAGMVGVQAPVYHFIPKVYFTVMHNLNVTLEQAMTKDQKDAFLASVNNSFDHNILKNLSTIENTASEGRLRSAQYDTRRGAFHRHRRRINKLYHKWNARYRYLWQEQEIAMNYNGRALEMREEMNKLGAKLVQLVSEGRPRFEYEDIKAQREHVRKQYRILVQEQRAERRKLVRTERSKQPTRLTSGV